ncbi:MAG: hypothetical protein WD716_01210 [Fimbriimonadaceae bacterium]
MLMAVASQSLHLELVDTIAVEPFSEAHCSPTLETLYVYSYDPQQVIPPAGGPQAKLIAYRRTGRPEVLETLDRQDYLCGTSVEGLPVVKRLNPLRIIGQTELAKSAFDPYHGVLRVLEGVIIGYRQDAYYATWEVQGERTSGQFSGFRQFLTQDIRRQNLMGAFALSPSRKTLAYEMLHIKESPTDRTWRAVSFGNLAAGAMFEPKRIEFSGPKDKTPEQIAEHIWDFQLLSDTTAVALLSASAFDDPKQKKELPDGFLGNDTLEPEDREFFVCRIDLHSGHIEVSDRLAFKAVSPLGNPKRLYVFDSRGTFALLTSPTELKLFRFR